MGNKVIDEEQNYAVKIMLKSEMKEVELESVRIEIRTLAMVDHPCIINFVEAIEDERYIYIVMEYIEKS